VALSEKG
jgi:alpha-tubulin suppressor-like RCC1 family protein